MCEAFTVIKEEASSTERSTPLKCGLAQSPAIPASCASWGFAEESSFQQLAAPSALNRVDARACKDSLCS